jgi:hypothetical protein
MVELIDLLEARLVDVNKPWDDCRDPIYLACDYLRRKRVLADRIIAHNRLEFEKRKREDMATYRQLVTVLEASESGGESDYASSTSTLA